ncbi:MAG: PEP-CTERM sorting domain-containing protein [Planctomycetes bacterium]|nr:PEP-CTERM sorting domain-containing protein [Planctomycetota bacterium]
MNFYTLRSRSAWAVATVFLLATTTSAATIVRFDTVLGSFDIQLYDDVMPVTVNNFLSYADADRYDGTVVHRNSDTQGRDFVIQGGGFTLVDPDPPNPASTITFENVVDPNNPDTPINDEPGGGVAGPSNLRGTIAMAKSGPNTVTSQWFINQGDNSFLDDPNRADGGFSAFGTVLGDGMTIVDAIGDLPLPNDFGFSISSPFNDLPLRDFNGSAINDIRVANTVTVNSISQLVVIPGDFNLDGSVDEDDLAIFDTGFGIASGAFVDDGDADMDGDVDGADFLLWQANFGATSALATVQSIPEPSSLALAVLGLLAFLKRR